MSDYESRRHDADLDARTPCPDCANQGIRNSLATCDDPHDPEPLPSPETLDYPRARTWAEMTKAVANAIRHEMPNASATRIAENLERHSAEYADRADDLMRQARAT